MGGAKTSPIEMSSYLRKIRKPLIERRRRERMNQNIDQLKDLIADTIKQNVAPVTRVDKADVLELTVTHLVQLKQQQSSGTMATDSSGYSAGYKDCAREVIKFLASNSLVDGALLNDLSSHLHNTYSHTSRNRTALENLRPDLFCSTPLRSNHFEEIRHQTTSHVIGYSPIPQMCMDASSQRGHVGTGCTSNSWSYSSLDSNGDSRSYSSMGSSSEVSSNESKRSSDIIVSIGDGKENAIGHVIKDTTWRPW